MSRMRTKTEKAVTASAATVEAMTAIVRLLARQAAQELIAAHAAGTDPLQT
jgi:hypothetical protein